MSWNHIGGGCRLIGDRNFPCDDEYENSETGERIRLYTTMDAHFDMPRIASTISELQVREGVQRPGEDTEDRPY